MPSGASLSLELAEVPGASESPGTIETVYDGTAIYLRHRGAAAWVVALLRGVSDDVEEVGTEEVRGEQTTHYRAGVDIRRAGGIVRGRA